MEKQLGDRQEAGILVRKLQVSSQKVLVAWTWSMESEVVIYSLRGTRTGFMKGQIFKLGIEGTL